MKPVYKVLLVVLSAALGAFFIFSAWAKTDPIAYFEFTIANQIPFQAGVAKFLARFFIGFEAGIGLLLLVNIYGLRRWIPKAGLALTILFSIQLIYLLISQGNDVNCGCMGIVAPMSPVQSLLKNIAIIAGFIILIKWHRSKDGKVVDVASIIVVLLVTAVPFFLYPATRPVVLPISRLYQAADSPQVDLRKGKHMLGLLSLSCGHCKDAAKQLQKIKENNPALPIFFVFASTNDSTKQSRLDEFMMETQATAIPYSFTDQKTFVDMVKLTGSEGVPVLMWIEDSTVVRKVTIPEINQKEIEQWSGK